MAVIGASRSSGKVGNAVLRNLIFGGPGDDREQGFHGTIVPVNPNAEEILGLKTCKDIADLREGIDLAVYAIPAAGVAKAVEAAANQGVRNGLVLSAGFYEMGTEGRRLGDELVAVAKRTGTRLIGPNCTGLFSQESNLLASFFSSKPFPGPVALISQSGAIAQALVQYSHAEAIGFRHVVTLGDKIDVNDAQLVEFFARDEGTEVIAVYVESLDCPRAFYDAARAASVLKPVVVLRGGSTGAGHRAARAHEGSSGISDSTLEGALTHPGIYRTDTLQSFAGAIRALAYQPPPNGRRVAIVTNGGGVGVLAADAATRAGLDVVRLDEATIAKLSKLIANPRTANNPIDLLGDAKPDAFRAALRVVAECPLTDAILVVLTDQAMTDSMDVAVKICEFARTLSKPIVASFVGQTGRESENYVERHGIPEYDFPELAVEGLKALAARGRYLRRLRRGELR